MRPPQSWIVNVRDKLAHGLPLVDGHWRSYLEHLTTPLRREPRGHGLARDALEIGQPLDAMGEDQDQPERDAAALEQDQRRQRVVRGVAAGLLARHAQQRD
jgi:hypothetical protein